MKPIKREMPDIVSEMQREIRAWKHTHRLTCTQVISILALVSAEYAENAYVEQTIQADDTDADRLRRLVGER